MKAFSFIVYLLLTSLLSLCSQFLDKKFERDLLNNYDPEKFSKIKIFYNKS